MRNHIMWAQTSRVQNVLKFSYPDEFDFAIMERARLEMEDDHHKGIRQDEYRSKLPAASLTRYTISINARELMRLANFFQKISFLNTEFSNQFSEAKSSLRYVGEILGYPENIQKEFKINNPISMDSHKIGLFHPKKIGNIITGGFSLPLGLRAQIVRHRGLLIEDNLIEAIERHGSSLDMETMLVVNITATVEEWKNVIRKRSCWIANYKVWSHLIESVSQLIGGNIPLPCDDGSCPFNADAMARYDGDDPNPPCPIHLKFNNLTPNCHQGNEMMRMVKADERDQIFWNHKIEELR